MKIKKLILGYYNVNCYIVSSEDSCFIIDPGADFKSIDNYLEQENLRPEFILNTHGHYDHIGAVPDILQKYNIPFYIDSGDEFIITDPEKNFSSVFAKNPLSLKTYKLIEPDDILFLSEEKGIKIYNTPGHTPGSIIVEMGAYLFTGDLLFRGGVGRTDLAGGDINVLKKSLVSLKNLDSKLNVLAGHGANSSLEYEISNNYYLSSDFLESEVNWL
ncbi:MAG: MBL fold metallo-hydrolase [Actinobacteria bacterium]|nr:MBL fold metallo-hydrolase [Actinomycetota bacterium]